MPKSLEQPRPAVSQPIKSPDSLDLGALNREFPGEQKVAKNDFAKLAESGLTAPAQPAKPLEGFKFATVEDNSGTRVRGSEATPPLGGFKFSTVEDNSGTRFRGTESTPAVQAVEKSPADSRPLAVRVGEGLAEIMNRKDEASAGLKLLAADMKQKWDRFGNLASEKTWERSEIIQFGKRIGEFVEMGNSAFRAHRKAISRVDEVLGGKPPAAAAEAAKAPETQAAKAPETAAVETPASPEADPKPKAEVTESIPEKPKFSESIRGAYEKLQDPNLLAKLTARQEFAKKYEGRIDRGPLDAQLLKDMGGNQEMADMVKKFMERPDAMTFMADLQAQGLDKDISDELMESFFNSEPAKSEDTRDSGGSKALDVAEASSKPEEASVQAESQVADSKEATVGGTPTEVPTAAQEATPEVTESGPETIHPLEFKELIGKHEGGVISDMRLDRQLNLYSGQYNEILNTPLTMPMSRQFGVTEFRQGANGKRMQDTAVMVWDGEVDTAEGRAAVLADLKLKQEVAAAVAEAQIPNSGVTLASVPRLLAERTGIARDSIALDVPSDVEAFDPDKHELTTNYRNGQLSLEVRPKRGVRQPGSGELDSIFNASRPE